MFGDEADEGPIAMLKMFETDNFSDKCSPNDNCWPSNDEWAGLNEQLGGKLLMDVKPYF